jgi:general secretion pathway protein G
LYCHQKGRRAFKYCLRKSRLMLSKKLLGGFTLLELMVVIAIIGTIIGIAVPMYHSYLDRARNAKAIAEISIMQTEIMGYELDNEEFPDSLSDIGRGSLLDPWENKYQYLSFANVKGKGKMRKDRFAVPLNTNFDLYSMGKDGKSQPPLTAADSHDDIVRANDGSFIGLASEY